MRLAVVFLCLILVLGMGSVLSAPHYSDEVSAAEAKKILSIKVLGIDMQTSMGEVKRILEAQGYTVKCRHSNCLVREGNMMFSASYPQARYDYTPLDEGRAPTAIIHTRSGADLKDCGVMLAAIEMFCTNGKNKFPCVQSGDYVKATVKSYDASDDGSAYSMEAKVDPPIRCAISLGRQILRQ